MSRVKADVEAIKSLREALITFANRQVDAIQSAESDIAQTISTLQQAERYWRSEVDRRTAALQDCYQQAMAAAQMGGYVDCSPLQYALEEAEQRLTRIITWQSRVDAAISQYRSAMQGYRDMLENELPRATSFLADRINALEVYYATRILTTAVALSGAGNAGIMGGVIGAVRYSKGELSRVMGGTGEQVAAQVLSEKFGLQEVAFDQPKHGFDRVFRAPGMPLIVMESKVSSSGELHLGQTEAGEQGSSEWIAANAENMADRDSSQWSPANERIASLVQEMGAENVPALSVVVNPASGLSDVYTRLGTGDWQLLHGNIRLDQVSSQSLGPGTSPEFKEGNFGGPERKG